MEGKRKILISNDDGIGAEGLRILAEAAVQFGEVFVVAPEGQCSGMSHRLTLGREQLVRRRDYPVEGVTAWSVDGMPADCVKAAVECLGIRPDVMFSGMNHGANAGFDNAYSGTVGAAMEALMLGFPAYAFSTVSIQNPAVAVAKLPEIIAELLEADPGPGRIWNVNFPDVPLAELKGILRDRSISPAQFYKDNLVMRQDEQGIWVSEVALVYSGEGATEGSDVRAILDGYISIGKIHCSVL